MKRIKVLYIKLWNLRMHFSIGGVRPYVVINIRKKGSISSDYIGALYPPLLSLEIGKRKAAGE